MSGFFYCSPLLVPFLTLLVRYILAPTLTVSWQGIAEGDLLGGGGGGWLFWGLARGRLAGGWWLLCWWRLAVAAGFERLWQRLLWGVWRWLFTFGVSGGRDNNGGSCSLWRRMLY